MLEEKLVALDGLEVTDSFVTTESSDIDLRKALVGGLARTGVRALRKSVYAVGGVMGVLRPCSCLMTAETQADSGVSTISEGNEPVLGVWSGGRTGFITAEGILLTTARESSTKPEQ